MYDVLQATFESENGLPDYLILGVPLLFGREIYALGFEDETLRAEIDKLKNRAEQFWETNRPRCFPKSSALFCRRSQAALCPPIVSVRN
jgi:hypothetical protein